MKQLCCLILMGALAGCGIETASTAATAAKLQAEQASQQPKVDQVKADLETAFNKSNEQLKQAGGN